jgi:molybdate/tungstate transport system substrate-binding protein
MGDDGTVLGRRRLLAGVAATLGAGAGCSRALGSDRPGPVSVLAAGSLSNAFENGLAPRVEARLRTEARGSAAAARLVAEGQKDPDIVAVADTALFDAPLDPDWYAEFATNSMVLAYNPDTEGGRRVAAAGPERWYRPLLEGDLRLGRTDPDLDPLGYRTLFVLELATGHYGLDTDLRAAVPGSGRVYPETQLVSQFETGGVDAAFAYRSMAIERGYEYVDLPAAVDLGDPDRADRYGTVSYELPGGVVDGGVVSYGASLRTRSRAAREAFEALTAGQYLTDFGFGVPDAYPRYTGDVPDGFAD